MSYIFPADNAKCINNLLKDYAKKLNIKEQNLLLAEPISSFSSYFGYKKLSKRCIQIQFIQGLQQALTKIHPYKLEDVLDISDATGSSDEGTSKDFVSRKEKQAYFMANQFLTLAAILFMCDSINHEYTIRGAKNNSELHKLLRHSLCYSSLNQPSDIDLRTIYCAASDSLKKYSLSDINAKHDFANDSMIDQGMWDEFTSYVEEQKKQYINAPQMNLPITDVVVPCFEKGARWVGWSLGFSAANQASRTTPMLSPTVTLSGLLVGASSMTSYSSGYWVAAAMATSIVQSTIIIFSAALMGEIVRYIGTGIGYGVGFSLDMGVKGILTLCQLIQHAFMDKTQNERLLNGINVAKKEMLISTDSAEKELHNPFSIKITVNKDNSVWMGVAEEKIKLDMSQVSDNKAFSLEVEKKLKQLMEKPSVKEFLESLEKKPLPSDSTPLLASSSTLFSSSSDAGTSKASEEKMTLGVPS